MFFKNFQFLLEYFFDGNNVVKLFFDHTVCERIAAAYGQLLLR